VPPVAPASPFQSWLNPGERADRLARDGGVRGVIRREVRYRLLPPFYLTEEHLLSYPLADPAPPLPPPEGVRVARFEDEDWSLLRPLRGPSQRRLFARRRDAGRIPVVAWRGDVPVGVTWITDRVEPSLEGVRFALPEGWAYEYGLYVHPNERGRGVGSAISNAAAHLARSLGFRHYCGIVYGRNAAAIRSARRASALDPAGRGVRVTRLGRLPVLLGVRVLLPGRWVRLPASLLERDGRALLA
jgi:GNAT superfamily N-acetyltransferase